MLIGVNLVIEETITVVILIAVSMVVVVVDILAVRALPMNHDEYND